MSSGEGARESIITGQSVILTAKKSARFHLCEFGQQSFVDEDRGYPNSALTTSGKFGQMVGRPLATDALLGNPGSGTTNVFNFILTGWLESIKCHQFTTALDLIMNLAVRVISFLLRTSGSFLISTSVQHCISKKPKHR